MNRRSIALGVPLAAALMLAACGGGASPSPAAPPAGAPASQPAEATSAPTDAGAATPSGGEATVACSALLSAGELESILGVTPSRTSENVYPGSSTCSWTYTARDAASEDFFQVQAEAAGDANGIWTSTKDAEVGGDNATAIPVNGIGDESYTWVGQGDYRKLYVRRGPRTLIIRGPTEVLVLATESTMIDLADRLFGRF